MRNDDDVEARVWCRFVGDRSREKGDRRVEFAWP